MTIKVDPSQIDTGIPHTWVMATGFVCSLFLLYCTYLNGHLRTDHFSVFGGLAAVCAIVWVSDTIKMLNSYGLATGVPSAGMIGFGSGIGAMMISAKFGYAAPLIAALVAAVTGLTLGYIANNVLNMKIPVMVKSLAELSAAGALTLLGLTALITGRPDSGLTAAGPDGTFISGGLIVTAFMLGAIAIQHPWNAVLPSGKQDRMFMLAAGCGFLTMIVAAIMSCVFISMTAVLVSLSVAITGWFLSYARYMEMSRRDAAAWLDTKPIPDSEMKEA